MLPFRSAAAPDARASDPAQPDGSLDELDGDDDGTLEQPTAVSWRVGAVDALPFVPGAHEPPPSSSGLANEPLPDLGGTMMAMPSLAQALATPFDTIAGDQLTLEQYASLTATCEVQPETAAQTLTEYGLGSPDDRVALDRLWRSRFVADPSCYARYKELLADYTAWLKQHPPR